MATNADVSKRGQWRGQVCCESRIVEGDFVGKRPDQSCVRAGQLWFCQGCGARLL